MGTSDATRELALLNARMSADEYNFEHFRTAHLLADAWRTLAGHGAQPGAPAPDFELPRPGGGSLRLRDLRGKPVLLHFGSYT
jgi:hypothetical protein